MHVAIKLIRLFAIAATIHVAVFDILSADAVWADGGNRDINGYVVDAQSGEVVEVEEPVPGSGVFLTAELPGGATMEFVWIEPGTFLMGSPSSESGRQDDEGPQHEVAISRGYLLGIYEVTQGQWESVMGSNPSNYSGENRPVEQVTWYDVRLAKLRAPHCRRNRYVPLAR